MQIEELIRHFTLLPEIIALGALGVALGLIMILLRSALLRAAARTTTLQDRLKGLEQAVVQLQEIAAVPPGSPALHGGKRTRAVTMLERGESPESVSAEIGAPRNEVELLMKVQRLLARQSG